MIERNVINLCVKCYIVIWLVRRIIEIVFCRKYNLLLEILGYKKRGVFNIDDKIIFLWFDEKIKRYICK